ncbi:MAG TPA: tail fiber protein [Allosphingosinicella sp.]|jgi:microcystin-dependent protein
MAEPFLAEIRIASFDFPPKGWAFCNGQLLPINQNQALFALLGTTYGGNGQTNFGLPNLQGKTPIHFGSGHNLGETGGSSGVTLNQSQLPAHTHLMSGRAERATLVGGAIPAATKSLAQAAAGNPISDVNLYATGNPTAAMAASSVTNTGGSQAHNNMMPYLVLNFVIALQGIFPSPN